MHIISSVGSVVGNNTSVHWAQTIKTPSVYGAIEVVDAAGIAQTIGMQVIGKMEAFCNQSIVSLHELEALADDGMREGVKSIALVVPVGTTLYVVIRGAGTVYLKRHGQYAKLLDHEGSISGEGKIGDIVLLISEACKTTVSESEMMGIFDHLPAADAAEKLAFLLNGKTESAGSAAVVFEITHIIPTEPVKPEDVEPRIGKVQRFIYARPHEKVLTMKRHIAVWGRKLKNPKVSVTMLLLILFIGSVLFGIQKEFSMKTDKQVTTIMTEVQRVYEEGSALMELNPVKGRERLVTAKTELTPLKEIVTAKTKEGRRVLELYAQIDSALTQAMHAYTEEPTLFYDAALLKSGGVVNTVALIDDTMILGDAKQKAVYSLSLLGKTGQIVAGGIGYDTLGSVAIHGSTGYALLADGINAIALLDKTTKQNVVKKSSDWGKITAMVSFGGNLYLLDTEKGRIWKYVATETGFSDIKEYLNPDTLPDLSKATGLSIDGSVWLGTTDGKIMRFTQGKENTFIPKGVDPAFGQQLVVYTSDSVNNIYVLDSQNKRVVVLDKDGMYLSQYVWKGDIAPTNLVVSEKQGKILLLVGNGTMFGIDLK